MFISDLDGTLARSDGTFSRECMNALSRLGEKNVPRVIATGRSLFSARKVLTPDFPIDYLIFSSGAGVLDFKTNEVLLSRQMTAAEIQPVFELLQARSLDFMLHETIPDNHRFTYYGAGHRNPDFRRRCSLYSEYCVPGEGVPSADNATQFLIVEPPHRAEETFEMLKTHLLLHSVIRATSPLDRISTWIEIFTASVSKSKTTDWLAKRLGVSATDCVAVGNDFNDVDLIAWAGAGYLVASAPKALKGERVPSNDEDGVAHAVRLWEKKFGK